MKTHLNNRGRLRYQETHWGLTGLCLLGIGLIVVMSAACSENTTSTVNASPLPTLREPTKITTHIPTTPTFQYIEQPEITLLPPPDAAELVVVYPKDGKLWVYQEEQPSQLSNNGIVYQPRFSPDGQQIAYLRQVDDFHLELWAINLDGSNERCLVSVADLDTIGATARSQNAVAINPYNFTWIPGGQLIVFNSQQVIKGSSPVQLDDLNLVDADTGQLTFSLLAGWGGEFFIAPDGNQVAISTPTQIIIANLDGSNYRVVFNYDQVNPYSESRFYASSVWAVDSSLLLVAIPPPDPLAEPRQLTEIWRITLDGVPPQLINTLDLVPFFDTPAMFSPDAVYLATIKELGGAAEMQRELSLIAMANQLSVVYSTGKQLNFVSWADDSHHFFFTQGEEQLMYLGALGSSPQPLSFYPYGIIDPRWVDDGRYIYIQQDGDKFHLYLGAIGSIPRLLDTLSEPPQYNLKP